MSAKPYPLLFQPIFKERVWGGRTLERLGKLLPAGRKIGESWELADLPESIEGGRSVVVNGSWAGRTLHDLIEHEQAMVLGSARLSEEGGFPLLIKYLDARENLSVQVHPTEQWVREHPGDHLKSEAWVVVDAEPGAVIYKGVREDVTAAQFAEDVRTGAVVEDLIAVPVAAGDVHYLPSGTCHALGAGIVVAEVQTPSDTTFRVYDWGRVDRALHIDQALACIAFGRGRVESDRQFSPIVKQSLRTQRLVQTEYFNIERTEISGPVSLPIVTNGLPSVWMMLEGSAQFEMPGGIGVSVSRGDTVLLPAGLKGTRAEFHGTGRVSLLEVTLPSPLRGMLA